MNSDFKVVLSQLYLMLRRHNNNTVVPGKDKILFDSNGTVKVFKEVGHNYKLYYGYSPRKQEFRIINDTAFGDVYNQKVIRKKNYNIIFNNVFSDSGIPYSIGTFDMFAEHKISLIKLGKHAKGILYDPDTNQVVVYVQARLKDKKIYTFAVFKIDKTGHIRPVQVVKIPVFKQIDQCFYCPAEFTYSDESEILNERVLAVYPSTLNTVTSLSSIKEKYDAMQKLSKQTQYEILVYSKGRIRTIPMQRLTDKRSISVARKKVVDARKYDFFPGNDTFLKYYNSKKKCLLRSFKIEPTSPPEDCSLYYCGEVFSEGKELPKGITYDKQSDQLTGMYKSFRLYRRHVYDKNKRSDNYVYTVTRRGYKVGTFTLDKTRDTYRFLCCPYTIMKKKRNKLYMYEIFHTEYKVDDPPIFAPETLLICHTVVQLTKLKVIKSEYIQFANVSVREGDFLPLAIEEITMHSHNIKSKIYSENAFKVNHFLFIRTRDNKFYVSDKYSFLNDRFIAVGIPHIKSGMHPYIKRIIVYDIKNNTAQTIVNNSDVIVFIKGLNNEGAFFATFKRKEKTVWKCGTLSFNKIVLQNGHVEAKNFVNFNISLSSYDSLVLPLQQTDYYFAHNSREYFAVLKRKGISNDNKYELVYLYDKQMNKIIHDKNTNILMTGSKQINNWLGKSINKIELPKYNEEKGVLER